MTALQTAMNLALEFEGFAEKMPDGRYAAYYDKPGKKWSIGIGCTGPDIKEGVIWTHDECLEHFKSLLITAQSQANHIFPELAKATFNQQAAVIDMIYNMGYGTINYKSPHLKDAILSGRWQEASVLIKQFDKANGVVYKGLTRRREAESNLLVS